MTAKPLCVEKRMPSVLRAFVPLAFMALGACAQADSLRSAGLGLISDRTMPETMPLATPPAPASRPSAPLTESFASRDLLTGDTRYFDVSRNGDSVRVRQSDGCVWTRKGEWFAPSDGWERCDDSTNWHTGTAQVRQTASIWPLTKGAQGRWTRAATSHTGRQYTRDTICRVTGAEAVIREGRAPTPAHLVVCEDGKRTRMTWYAPGEGPIAFRRVHAQNGVEEAWVRL